MGRMCVCAPATHPGSFKCGLHRTPEPSKACSDGPLWSHQLEQQKLCESRAARLNLQMKTRINAQGEVARRALMLSRRPPCNQMGCHSFERRPSRLSNASLATEGEAQTMSGRN
eukprot:Gb_27597 [translate_table: standard]